MNKFSHHDHDSTADGVAALKHELPRGTSRQARQWLSAAMGVLIFAAGGICGAAATQFKPDPPPLTDPTLLPASVADRLQRELELTDAQRNDIEQVIRAHQPRMMFIRARVAIPLKAELRQVMEEIAAVLKPDQLAQWQPRAEQRLELAFPSRKSKPRENSTSANKGK